MLGLLLVFLWSSMPIAAITWRADVGGAVYSSPVFSPSGALYVSSYDGNLYSIAANGSRVWRIFLGPLYYSPLLVQYAGMAEAVPHASEFPKILAGYNIGGGGLGVVASVSTEGRLLSRDSFGVGSLQCAPQHLQGSFLSCNDGGDIVALSGDGRGQLWSADVHGGGVLSNIVTFNDVLEGMLCVGGAAHRIVCLDVNGSTIWNTFGGGGAGDYVTALSSARGGSSLVSGAFDFMFAHHLSLTSMIMFLRLAARMELHLPIVPSAPPHLLCSLLPWPCHVFLQPKRRHSVEFRCCQQCHQCGHCADKRWAHRCACGWHCSWISVCIELRRRLFALGRCF